MPDYEKQIHEFPPVFDAESRILILGSFPSVKSREQGFYYGHPQNRFWKVIAAVTAGADPQSSAAGCTVFSSGVPVAIEEKKSLLLRHGIALWDVAAACEIIGSSDSSIRNVVPNDLSRILNQAQIRQIYCNGSTAYHLYCKYQKKQSGFEAIRLPSTSPANAAWTLDRLIDAWARIAAV